MKGKGVPEQPRRGLSRLGAAAHKRESRPRKLLETNDGRRYSRRPFAFGSQRNTTTREYQPTGERKLSAASPVSPNFLRPPSGRDGGKALDGESLHELGVALALARNHQDSIGNPLSVVLISRTHSQFHARRLERSVHGFDLGIVEVFPHPLSPKKVRCRRSVMLRTPRMDHTSLCHPGCCRAVARGAAAHPRYARR